MSELTVSQTCGGFADLQPLAQPWQERLGDLRSRTSCSAVGAVRGAHGHAVKATPARPDLRALGR